MAQYITLTLDTMGPSNVSISLLDFYKDNSTPIALAATDAAHMKIWINQTAVGTKDDPEVPTSWSPFTNSWTPTFSVEGKNYIHLMLLDDVGNPFKDNEDNEVFNSTAVVFDKTAPVVSAMSIANDADIVTNQTQIVRVTASDAKTGVADVSGIQKTTLSGDLAVDSETEFIWTNADRANGYKDCVIKLTANTDPSHRETKTVYATATDNAGNTSERNSDNIVLYTGGVDPVIVLKKPDDTVIGKHYGEKEFKLQLHVLTGEASMIYGYKVYGDFADNGSSVEPTPEPTDFTPWPTDQRVVSLDKYLTSVDGNKTISGKIRMVVSSIADTVANYAALASVTGANDGDIYKVTADETHSNVSTVYRYNLSATEFQFYGILEEGDQYAIHDLESTSVHHSEATPQIVLTTANAVISDKTGHNSTVLTAAMTTSCNIYEYKAVAYATAEAASAGTSADVTNVDLSGTTEIPSGSSWQPTLLESKLSLAVSGEGQKYIVVYAKNLCDKWGKSNTVIVTVDKTAPVGTITVDQYYNENKGFTASATDSVVEVSKMQAWVDTSADSETPPITSTEYDYAINPTAAQVDWTGKSNGNCYCHIKYTDAVGNSAVAHSNSFIYDDVAPTGCSISAPTKVGAITISVTLSASDVTSGMGQMKIFGDVDGAATAEQASWQPYATAANIVLTNGDGTKTLNALFKDNAGNVISAAVSCTTILDTGAPSATIQLYKNDESAVLPARVNTVNFKAHIGGNDAITSISKYKVWGGITEAATKEEATWHDFVPITGQTYMSISLALTTGDGLKTVNVVLADEVGNESQAAVATVTLDTTIPIVECSGQDYNKVSYQHTLRKAASSVDIEAKYCDEMHFNFSADSDIVEWKVCVNEAGQQPATAVPIGTTYGSINMTGTNLVANTSVSCMVTGRDFGATSKVDDNDGAYEIIVYVKDEAGNWSAVHPIS